MSETKCPKTINRTGIILSDVRSVFCPWWRAARGLRLCLLQRLKQDTESEWWCNAQLTTGQVDLSHSCDITSIILSYWNFFVKDDFILDVSRNLSEAQTSCSSSVVYEWTNMKEHVIDVFRCTCQEVTSPNQGHKASWKSEVWLDELTQQR